MIFLGQAGAVVLDNDGHPGALAAARRLQFAAHDDFGLGVLEGVVEKIAEHLLEILLLAAEFQAAGADRAHPYAAFGMNALEGADNGLNDVFHGGHSAQAGGAGGAAGAVEIDVDLVAHHVGLLQDLAGQPALFGARFVGEHAERGFQGVGQIAHLGAGALDDLAVGADEHVQLMGDRLDFRRIDFIEFFAPALADFAQFIMQNLQRTQAIAHLHEQGDDQRHRQQGQHQHESAGEGGHFGAQFVEIAGHEHRIALLAAIEGIGLLQGAQAHAVGVTQIDAREAIPVAAGGGENGGVQPGVQH